MIIEKQGNVLDVTHGVIVQGCNSHGIMASGLAKEVKARHPGAFKVYVNEYVKAINSGLPGLPLGSFTAFWVTPTKVIVNAITQQDYGREPGHLYVNYEALGEAFVRLSTTNKNIRNVGLMYGIHFPLIGCGLANGDWNIVEPLIDNCVADDFEKTLWVYTP
jgi:O-acetyl-ADP-ribose deacetylase (regulator of RNase III)